MIDSVGIIGAGTMGAGIAQVAATAGTTVFLLDVDRATTDAAIAGVGKRLDRLVEKGRMSAEERQAAGERLVTAESAADLSNVDLVIEAIVEDLDVKVKVLGGVLEHAPNDAIIATNTSSLSVTEIGSALGAAHRTVGMHFFNPAPLLKLVEVIAGAESDPAIVNRVVEIAEAWGKVVARAADVPGFIVNHVARPYYLEAFRILEERLADAPTIDNAMKTLGGFRMGPLELTDLIGQDVNTATTRSVWERLDHPPLLAPSELQESLVEQGRLGRKSGRGVYDYGGESPVPADDFAPAALELDDDTRTALNAFCAGATDADGDERSKYVFARILTALIEQARAAADRGVGTAEDIDIALRYGVNYPKGPFTWAGEIGEANVDAWRGTLTAGRA